ncbi:MAG: hypothetical protein NTY68_03205, partial [Candidatus Micrarchaeota archaeon]|nr:hypothetical protein [Candidatus Micrarchaeota archaeon]
SVQAELAKPIQPIEKNAAASGFMKDFNSFAKIGGPEAIKETALAATGGTISFENARSSLVSYAGTFNERMNESTINNLAQSLGLISVSKNNGEFSSLIQRVSHLEAEGYSAEMKDGKLTISRIDNKPMSEKETKDVIKSHGLTNMDDFKDITKNFGKNAKLNSELMFNTMYDAEKANIDKVFAYNTAFTEAGRLQKEGYTYEVKDGQLKVLDKPGGKDITTDALGKLKAENPSAYEILEKSLIGAYSEAKAPKPEEPQKPKVEITKTPGIGEAGKPTPWLFESLKPRSQIGGASGFTELYDAMNLMKDAANEMNSKYGIDLRFEDGKMTVYDKNDKELDPHNKQDMSKIDTFVKDYAKHGRMIEGSSQEFKDSFNLLLNPTSKYSSEGLTAFYQNAGVVEPGFASTAQAPTVSSKVISPPSQEAPKEQHLTNSIDSDLVKDNFNNGKRAGQIEISDAVNPFSQSVLPNFDMTRIQGNMKNMVGDFIKTSQTFYELAQRTEAALFNSQESTLDKVYYTAVDTSITNALPVRHDSDRAVYEGKDTYLTIFADAMTSSTNDAFSRQFGTSERRSIPGIVLPKIEPIQPIVENVGGLKSDYSRRPESAPYEEQAPTAPAAELAPPAVQFKITKKTSTVWGTAEQVLNTVDPEFKDKPVEERNSLISALTNEFTGKHRDVIENALVEDEEGRKKFFLDKDKKDNKISITKEHLTEIFDDLKGSKNSVVKAYFAQKVSPSGEFSFGTEDWKIIKGGKKKGQS